MPLSGETQSCRFASPIGTKLGYRQNFCNKQPYATFLFRSAAQADIAACLGNGTSSSDCGSPSGTGFGYDGYRYDPETGLYHTGARYYDPRLGRFLQPDPIGQAGGVNLYAYVGNDPLNGTDPSGLWGIFGSWGLTGVVKRRLEKSRKYGERVIRAGRALAVVSFFIAMLGLLGGGYCEHEAHFSARLPDPVHGYINGVYFKGEMRYVDDLDSAICATSGPLAFSGIGLGILIGGVCFLVSGRLP